MSKHVVASSIIAALMLLAGAAEAAGVKATLRSQVTSDLAHLRLADVASLQGDPREVARAGSILVAVAPRVGHVRRLDRVELSAIVRRAGQYPEIEWSGAPHIQITAAAVTLDGDEIGRAALAALRQTPGPASRKYELAHPVPAVEVPARDTRLRPRPLDAAPGARRVVWIDVMVDGSVYRSVQVPVRVMDERAVLVARRDMAPGEDVLPGGFEKVLRDVADLRSEALAPDALSGTGRLKRRVGAGEVLTKDSLLPAGSVLPGDQVRVIAQADQVRLEMRGTVVHGGAPGQRVDVRVAHSGEALNGTLLPDAAVLVR